MTASLFEKVKGEKQRHKKRVLGKTMRDPGRGRKAELDPSVCFNILTVALTHLPPILLEFAESHLLPAARESGTHTFPSPSATPERGWQLSLAGLILEPL